MGLFLHPSYKKILSIFLLIHQNQLCALKKSIQFIHLASFYLAPSVQFLYLGVYRP